MNSEIKKMVKGFRLDQVNVETDSFKLCCDNKQVDMYVDGEDDTRILVKSHGFTLYLSQIMYDLSHECKQSGMFRRMFGNEDFEVTNKQLQSILLEATCNVAQTELEEGEDFIDPRYPDLKKGEVESTKVMYVLKDIVLSEEGVKLVNRLYDKLIDMVF